jgi:hypothetical protein
MEAEPSSAVAAPRRTRRPGAVRLRAWLVAGPLGRGAAFAIEFSLALGRVLARRLR